MGCNSVVVVMNDALGMIEEDPTFGYNLAHEVMTYHRTGGDVPAHSPKGGIHCNAATVLSSAHADCPQVVVVKHNTGYVYKYKEVLPDHVLSDLKWVLEQHGFSVRKKTVKKVVK